MWSILVCKLPQFLAKSYRFRQFIILFQKTDTPRQLKIYIMFCLPAGAKYPFFLGSSSWTISITIQCQYQSPKMQLSYTILYLMNFHSQRNEPRFRHEIATKLFGHETIFNFHMSNFNTIIENIKNYALTFKNVKSN